MSSLRIGDVCSMKCDKGFYRTLSNHTICERGSHDQEGHWSDGIFECHECIKWAEWNGSMYRFINTTQNLEESKMICKEQSYYDAHLVYIEDEDENDFITNMILQCGSSWSAWIGLSDEDEEDKWKWGGSNAEYLNWGIYDGRNEPNGGENENYVFINYYGMGKWYDVGPNRNIHAVCEREM
ncbi:Collectin-12 [Holothuria leucospilota]|uniref:Collectin-12 n=1 Tax=Holothuria leucospilota TaxID=206669 RepID=A0A9Q0YS94_HOLLE|nr:Collectin-12 [Holothuria leucospilota]